MYNYFVFVHIAKQQPKKPNGSWVKTDKRGKIKDIFFQLYLLVLVWRLSGSQCTCFFKIVLACLFVFFLFVSLFLCLFLCLVCLSVYLAVHPWIYQLILQPVCLPVCLSVCLPVCLSVFCLSVFCLSFCLIFVLISIFVFLVPLPLVCLSTSRSLSRCLSVSAFGLPVL